MNPMAKKGQVSLEAVVLLLILISLFAQVTLPLTFWGSNIGKAVASTAMVVDSVNNFADAINLVGVSGDGARKVIRLNVPIEATHLGITCTNVSVTGNFEGYGDLEEEWPSVEKTEDTRPTLIYEDGTKYDKLYRREVDFEISNYVECVDNTQEFEGTGGTVYVCIQNKDGEIVLEFVKDLSTPCTWA
jgi:hypothetical protein